MNDFIVTLRLEKFQTVSAAQKYLEDHEIEVLKHFKPGYTFQIRTSREDFQDLEHLVVSEKSDAAVSFQSEEAYSTEHLNIIADPENSKSLPKTGFNANDLFKHQGEGCVVYHMDTGVNREVLELQESQIQTIYNRYTDDQDNAGHGTAVASLIVGKNLGTAPKAELRVLKIFDQTSGQIMLSDLLAAFSALIEDHEKTFYKVKIVCLPWVVTKNALLDEYIRYFNKERLVVVAAAGNEGVDVNTLSPAGVEEIITVGAHNDSFVVSQFANSLDPQQEVIAGNFGAQVDIFAPGVDISVMGVQGKYTRSSGTSLSAGLVAGVITHYIAEHPAASVDDLKTLLIARGSEYGNFLNFDQNINNVDYAAVNRSITVTYTASDQDLSELSGHLTNVKQGDKQTINLGLNPKATDLAVLEFAMTPPWISLNLETGDLDIDTSDADQLEEIPGIYLFAIRGNLNGTVTVKEYSIGVYVESQEELTMSDDENHENPPAFYYDHDLGEYDKVLDFQTASAKP